MIGVQPNCTLAMALVLVMGGGSVVSDWASKGVSKD